MAIRLTWHGHATWQIDIAGQTLIVDPFFKQNPACPTRLDSLKKVDAILVSHGHFDHIADAAELAAATGARVVAVFEIAQWLSEKHQVKKTIGMNLGGKVDLSGVEAAMTIAHHSSQLPDGSYGGNPAGWVLRARGRRIYFACDTALFDDMRRIGAPGLDLAVLPIGDLFTMGPEESIAATRLLQPIRVAPSHYNTWPPIAQDARVWAERVRAETSAEPIVVEPGQSFEIE